MKKIKTQDSRKKKNEHIGDHKKIHQHRKFFKIKKDNTLINHSAEND